MKLKITGIIFVVFAMLFASCSANGGEKREPEMAHTSSVQTENEMQASEPTQTQSTQTQSAQTQSTQATRGLCPRAYSRSSSGTEHNGD